MRLRFRPVTISALWSVAACSGNADAAAERPVAGDIAAQIAQRVEVRENPTVFALFAMLNAGGYDDENGARMHPVRQAVRAALPRLLPDSVFTNVDRFYRAHASGAGPSAYAIVAMATWGPPNFSPTSAWTDSLSKKPEFRGLSGLNDLLRMFYHAFPVDSVYRAQQLEYRAYIVDYTAAIRREVAAALAYARVRDVGELTGTGDRGRVVVIPNLLLSYDQAYSFVLSDTLYSIEGPQVRAGYDPHEFVHAILNAPNDDTVRNGALQRNALPVYLAVQARPAVAGFKTLSTFVEENLVRAVTLRYRAARDPARDSASVMAATGEAHKGFVLVPYFYDQLKQYERQPDPLRVYYPKLFEQLDAQRELTRWRDSTVRP